MKAKFLVFFGFIMVLGCGDNSVNTRSLEYSQGLSLWWDHKIFGEDGRGFIFAFHEKERRENSYDLVFDYKIDARRKSIKVYYQEKIDQGKCPYFPSPYNDDGLCMSDGSIFIPEEKLKNGKYQIIVYTASYVAYSILDVSNEKVNLEIQDEKFVTSSVTDVFPTPKDLLYGTVKYIGKENADEAQLFFAKLEDSGFEKTVVANPPFNLETDENGEPRLRFVEPDRYYQSFLFRLNMSFTTACQITTSFFEKNNVDIYFYTSNGDQATFSKRNGISIHNAGE